MSAITFNTEAGETSRSPRKRVEAVLAGSHVATTKRFCKFALTTASPADRAVGIVALKTAILIPQFNH